MEINKQLFEDVLAGKLKGTFVLRNGQKINSNDLLDVLPQLKQWDSSTIYTTASSLDEVLLLLLSWETPFPHEKVAFGFLRCGPQGHNNRQNLKERTVC